MPILLAAKRLRLALNAASYGNFTDALTASSPKFPIASALRVEVAAFFGKTNTALALVDIANWVSATCTFRPVTPAGLPDTAADALAQKTVLAAAMDAALTQAAWDDFTGEHAAFEFTEAEINNIPLGKVWCVVTALLTTGETIPVQFGAMEAVPSGYKPADTVLPGDETAWSKAEADARYLRVARTALTGGAADALDAEPTVALPVLTTTRLAVVAGVLSAWQLQAGATAEDPAAGIVRPDDYAAATNEKVWVQVL